MDDDVICFLLNFFGTVLSVIGLVANVLGFYLQSYAMWVVADVAVIAMFYGVWKERWELNGGALLQMVMYGVFMLVSIAGILRLL